LSNYRIVLARGVDEKLEAVSESSYSQVVAAIEALGVAPPLSKPKGSSIPNGLVDAGGYRIHYAVDPLPYGGTVLIDAIFPIPKA